VISHQHCGAKAVRHLPQRARRRAQQRRAVRSAAQHRRHHRRQRVDHHQPRSLLRRLLRRLLLLRRVVLGARQQAQQRVECREHSVQVVRAQHVQQAQRALCSRRLQAQRAQQLRSA
jgi:hypothetical protein